MLRAFAFSALALSVLACSDDSPAGGGGSGAQGGAAQGGAAQGGAGGAPSGGASTGGASTGGAGGAGGGQGWQIPSCTQVQGTGAVTIATQDGASLLPTSEVLSGIVYTFGLVATDLPNVLVASSGGRLLRSIDAGCTWADVGALPVGTLSLTAAKGGIVYGHYDNQDVVVRIDAKDPVTVLTTDPPGLGIHGLGVDEGDSDHVRVLDDAGQLQDSLNGGIDWAPVGVPVASNALLYTAVFDPRDLDHVLVGLANTGVRHSEDAGATWQTSVGVGSAGNANGFSIAFAPSDSAVVYLEGFDLGAQIGQEVRRLWRSTDGGTSFTPIVSESVAVTLTNGVLLAPHPVDAGVLYFEFGTYFQGYGTDLYKYDQATGQVTKTHNSYDDVSSIAFHPQDPSVMYFGLTSEDVNGAAP